MQCAPQRSPLKEGRSTNLVLKTETCQSYLPDLLRALRSWKTTATSRPRPLENLRLLARKAASLSLLRFY